MAAGSRPRFVDEVDDNALIAAIRAAEQSTTGQIRVHLSTKAKKDIEITARRRFARLRMYRTPDRNAVLLYLQPRARRFFVLGDTGLDVHGGAAVWEPVAAALSSELAAGRTTEGIVGAIEHIGRILKELFPREPGTPDSPGLPDEPSRD